MSGHQHEVIKFLATPTLKGNHHSLRARTLGKARETLRFKKRIGELWNLEVVKLTGAHGALARQAALYGSDLYARDPDTCCRINKVEPGAPGNPPVFRWESF